jgi:hypothetical protein
MFLLHVRYASGYVSTIPFETAFARALVMIGLASQPVTLRMQDC